MKKKFYIVLFVLLFSLSLGLFSISYGSVIPQVLTADLQRLYKANYISENVYKSAVNSINTTASTQYSQVGFGMQYNNYYAWFIGKTSSNGPLRLYLAFPNSTSSSQQRDYFFNPYSSGTLVNDISGYAYYINLNINNQTTNFSYGGISDAGNYSYIYTTCPIITRVFNMEAGEEYGGNIMDVDLKFEQVSSSLIDIYNNGSYLGTAHLLRFSNYGNRVLLGTFKNFSNVRNIEGTFGPFVSPDIIDGTQAQFNYTNGLTYNGSLIFDSSNGNLYVDSKKLIYNQAFGLSIQFRQNLMSEWDLLDDFYYYAVPLEFSGTSGEMISPNLNNNTDIGFINAFEEILSDNNYSGNLQYILSNELLNLFSGDAYSGDFLNSETYMNIFGGVEDKLGTYDENFVYSIYRNVISCFETFSDDESITFDLRGEPFTVYSSQFYVPEGALKVFIKMFLLGGFVILFITQLFSIRHILLTFDLNSFTKLGDTKHTFFM